LSLGRRIKVELGVAVAVLVVATGTAGVLAHKTSAQPSSQAAAVVACGGPRWPVKTLADPGVAQIVRSPVQLTVQQLRAAHPPPVKGKTPRQSGWETAEVSVAVELTNGKLVHDGDLQLVVHAEGHPEATMIAELPDSSCLHAGTGASDASAMTAARGQIVSACGPFTSKKKPLRGRAQLVGLRFLDTMHAGDNADDNARGAAPDEVEVHPVLLVTGLQCTAVTA